jgi:hypothetical protein
LPIKEFCICLLSWIKKWSVEYSENQRSIKFKPKISWNLWREAHKFALVKRTMKMKETTNYFTCRVPSGDHTKITAENRDNFSSFEEFEEIGSNFYYVKIPREKENYLNGTCDCPNFFKEYICKHILGIALRLKHAVLPKEVCNVTLGKKRTRGRPSTIKKALKRE